ncbi:MAG: M48 family metalloprotease [Gammaproteobacteria bacterium]|nr:M48 family metalloprotease [Gammaproteobacteria bacterium]
MHNPFACLLAASLACAAVDAADLTATVRKPGVIVYAAPNLDSGTLTKLKQDAAVSIASQQGLWYEVRLPDGQAGFLRINDVRVNYGSAEGGDANVRVLTGGKAGAGRVSETAGVRGIDESELKAASFDQAQLDAMAANRSDPEAAAAHAGGKGWQATTVAWDGEAKPRTDKQAASKPASSASGGLAGVSGMLGSLSQRAGSLLGAASKAAPKSESEQAAEELALGPQIAGRVLGARPLWNDAEAQKRANLVGRWVASQTSRPDLPWTFGMIDTAEVNAFAAPGGYILVTRGLYELLASDAELAAVLGHEISHAVERDHYNVIRKQELTTAGKEIVAGEVSVGGGIAENYARQYVEKHGATILVTSLDRQAEYRADRAAEIYLARSGMNPMALYAVLQKMMALGRKSASLAALYKTHPPLDARLDRIDERGYEKLQPYVTRD